VRDRPEISVYILTRNEEANIGKCLAALAGLAAKTTVLDSGSTDETLTIARRFAGVSVQSYRYVSHEKSYNELTLRAGDEWVMVLDADMEVHPSLWSEIGELIESESPLAIGSPVRYCIEGKPLSWASLCPPKVYVFKGGRSYFVASGHGERLKSGISPVFTRHRLVHNDLKAYEAFLKSQVFYGTKIIERSKTGEARWYDRVRLYSPLMAGVMLVRALGVRCGLLDGRAGLLYALDRMIAELIFFRLSLARGIRASARSPDESPCAKRGGPDHVVGSDDQCLGRRNQ
jgi:glycosyltransferase involved in cell wall biosynthesis